MSHRKTILRQIETLPTMSPSAVRLAALLGQEETSTDELEAVVRPDLALTANLLRYCNSAGFALREQVSSVRQAITLLGTKRLFEVVTTESFSRVIPARLEGYDLSAAGYWQHGIAVAVMGERLATALSVAVPDLTFTAGLLHDVGKLAICVALEKQAERVLEEVESGEISFVDAERKVLGIDHPEVGALICKSWNLPASLLDPIRYHHHPEQAPEANRGLVDLVHVADCLATMMGMGIDVGGLHKGLDSQAAERLGVKVEALEEVASEALDQIHEMTELFAQTTKPE